MSANVFPAPQLPTFVAAMILFVADPAGVMPNI